MLISVLYGGKLQQKIHAFSMQDVRPRPLPPSVELRALEIITYIALALSIICLLITIITYLVSKYVRSDLALV